MFKRITSVNSTELLRKQGGVIGFLKGKSAIQIFRKFTRMRKKYYGQHYWSRGYCVSTVGLDEETDKELMYRWQQKRIGKKMLLNNRNWI